MCSWPELQLNIQHFCEMPVSLTMNVIFHVLQVSGRHCKVYSRVCASMDVRSTGHKQCGGRAKTWGYVHTWVRMCNVALEDVFSDLGNA